MGSGSSREPVVGAPANPRVVYADKLAKQEKKTVLLDTPVLIDVQHGSIRYRYTQYDGEPRNKAQRVEKPYEGIKACGKTNYFYHSRLNTFGSDADKQPKDGLKVLHVTHGPVRVRQKKLFYVYGHGWDAEDGLRVKPTLTKEEGKDFSWPEVRIPNDLYYNLLFTNQDGGTSKMAEDVPSDDLQSVSDKTKIRLTLCDTDRVSGVRAKLAIKLMKAASNIHVCYNKQELRNDDVIKDLQSEGNGMELFSVEMELI
ncbi:uncharacterized protein LOC121375722 [Gigantopelta aegis]|uniref:uncharacterized protein LOC121375722 n=1 Tax=Gigantopelta aegis TaxID=1735272 RepID=UPI001B88B2AA|nr:uncharacterized protein LOC121375722 [Gigantopelta aegis]